MPQGHGISQASDIELDARKAAALYLWPDTALILSNAKLLTAIAEYTIAGTLYCVRLGPSTTVENCDEFFELLLARNVSVRSL